MPGLMKINILPSIDHLKQICIQYIAEIKYLKFYILTVAVVITLFYSVLIFFDADTVSKLGEEDKFFEWLGCIFFIIASLLFLLTFLKTRNIFFLILAIAMFICSGEEISWGQRILRFSTPSALYKINVQREFTLHNIDIFNNKDFNGTVKHGLIKLLEINFLFKLFTMFFGILLPFCAYHIKFISRMAMKLKVPIPPISIGLFFFLSWLIYQFISQCILPHDVPFQLFDSIQEIFECSESYVLFMISLYFYNKRKILIQGQDIKMII
jgi:hypothetical protein